ncbi:nucleotide-binding universal stress UspA family protein [Ilumatobacter fluminis]|uniref:Nucleotide-binding universal stress UspA family protein n=1 Tax=Ilumatobacter fluminis TaxID=467091 RepID=A0A4R7I2A7_9ACTN|nr:universal stress protein [Ilumatobacter fluminis]TDT17661.1 nucleotide-binding universal stress UspA family protein [Ilumatobacter fluminis]
MAETPVIVEAPVIVVGVDSSAESDTAIEWARAVAPSDARIVLVHAWELPIVTGYDVVIPLDPAEIEASANAGLQAVVDELDDDRIETELVQGHAGKGLIGVADERDASMIVVGHRGKGRMSMMLGSTANYVVHHSERPVIVIRGDHVAPPARIVVGVDDHDIDDEHVENESVRAVRWAYDLPGARHVEVVHAWFLPALAVGMFTPAVAELDQMDAAANAVVERIVEVVGPPPDGVTATGAAVRGTPGFALIEASRDADLVVVGSRGRGGFAELLLGSTSAEVAAHSHAPVAVIR